jgi:hypothetical protein
MFDMLAPDLVGPSAFLLLNLLFISVVDVNDTGSPGCRTKRSRNLIGVVRHRRNFLRDILGFKMSDGARSEITGGARVLVGLCHAYEG